MQQKFIYAFFLLTILGCEDKLSWIKTPDVNKVPVVSSITPSFGSVGTRVEITGANFSSVLSSNNVSINGTAANVIEASATKLVFIAPDETTGPVVVIVNGEQASNNPVFTYQ